MLTTHALWGLLHPDAPENGRILAIRASTISHLGQSIPVIDVFMDGEQAGPLGPVLYLEDRPVIPESVSRRLRQPLHDLADSAAVRELVRAQTPLTWTTSAPDIVEALGASRYPILGLGDPAVEHHFAIAFASLRPMLEGKRVLEFDAPAYPWVARYARARTRPARFESPQAASAAARLGWPSMEAQDEAPEAVVFHGRIDWSGEASGAPMAIWIGPKAESDAALAQLSERFVDVRRYGIAHKSAPAAVLPEDEGDPAVVLAVGCGPPCTRDDGCHTAPASVTPRLRVLYVRQPGTEHIRVGGVEIEVAATTAALRARGIDVVETFEYQVDARGFDVVHQWQGTGPHFGIPQITAAKRAGRPVVLTPIYADISGINWFANAQAWMVADPRTGVIAQRMDALRDRSIAVNNEQPPPLARDPRDVAGMRRLALEADHLFVHAYGEAREISRVLGVVRPFTLVPSGVDARSMRPDVAPAPLVPRQRPYVLMATRYEAQKNLLGAALAAKELDVDLVLVGKLNEGLGLFAALLTSILGRNAVFLPPLPHDHPWLASLFAHAGAVLVPSWTEVFSLTALNAAACGAPLVTSHGGYHAEHFGNHAYYVDAADVKQLRATIALALSEREKRREERLAFADRIRAEYSWEAVADRMAEAYGRLAAQESVRV